MSYFSLLGTIVSYEENEVLELNVLPNLQMPPDKLECWSQVIFNGLVSCYTLAYWVQL